MSKRYYYVWFHHMFIDKELMNEINDFIEKENKTDYDWETFNLLKKDVESQSKNKFEYFPMYVFDEKIKRNVKLNKERFKKIYGAECECG